MPLGKTIVMWFRWIDETYDRFIRYPGWLEMLAGVLVGVLWTILALSTEVDIQDRPAFRTITYFLPWFWKWIGLILAGMHLWGLVKAPRLRKWAALSSSVFWWFVSYGLVVGAVMVGNPIPQLTVAAIGLAVIHFALTTRLWRGYHT